MTGTPANADAASLEAALNAFQTPGIVIGHRVISSDDDTALLPEEIVSIASSDPKSRRASGAVRIAGRQVLQRLGFSPFAIPKGPTGAPQWPDGLVGSFAHDDRVAVAAAALRADVAALGVDVEPAAPLSPDLIPVVVTPGERIQLADDPWRGRLHFALKEAVYKALSPLDGVFLEFHDIEIDLPGRKAFARNGRTLDLRYCVCATHLVAVAWIASKCRAEETIRRP